MNIIGYHMSGLMLVNSQGESTTENHLSWLAAQPEGLKLFYNLNYAVAQLAKAIGLTKEEGRKLLSNGKLYWPPYQLRYIPGKFLSVRDGFYTGAPFSFYADASQYDDNAKLEASDEPFYCIVLAEQAVVTGEQVYNALVKIGLQPSSLTSPIRAYQKEVLDNLGLPTIDDTPPEAAEMAYECCHGNWVESFARGHWDEAWDYDISSAYPAQVARLLDLRYGHWENYPLYLPTASYGYCRGQVTINKPFSPIVFNNGGRNYTPTGKWAASITKQEWDFIREFELGEFEADDCWWWVADEEVRPLANIVNNLYRYKEMSRGPELDVIKRVMSGIWGKFLELRRGEMGPLFNPVWGAEVEVRTRLEVARFCIERGVTPISVAVDGVTLDKAIDLGVSNGMGSWKLSAHCPCLAISSGLVALREKYNGLDFSLDYNWLMEQARGHSKAHTIEMRRMSPVTIAKAVQEDRWAELGNMVELSKVIDMRYEEKRLYSTEPKNWSDLLGQHYTSEPLDISFIEKGE